VSFVDFIKGKLNVAALIVLLGFAGNVLAYVYKAGYFFYFHIPISLISFAFYEVVLCSVGPIIIGLLLAYAHWITEAPENELAKLLAKHYLKRRIRLLNTYIFFMGSVIICAVQWYITRNLMTIPISLFIGLALLLMASSFFRENLKKDKVSVREEKRIKKEEQRQQKEIDAYRAEKMKTLSGGDMSAKEIEERIEKDIALAKGEFEQNKTAFKGKVKSLRIVLYVWLILLSLCLTAILGITNAVMKLEYPIVIYQNEKYVSVAEYNDHFICTMYDQTTKRIVPAYRLIPFTDVELVLSKRIGRLSVSK
jgi:hypothetical protein